METIILSIALALELSIMAYSLITKSSQEKIRSRIHIIAFAVFSILMGMSVFQWSVRWFGFVAWLFIQAARGLWVVCNPSVQGSEYTVKSVVWRAIPSVLLVFISVTPALIFPQYEPLPTSGSYTVATERFTYTNESRIEQLSSSGESRKVNVAFWYPQNRNGDETYPLVVFSHGGLGTENSNESLYLELASHGYVVCSIGHPYHALWTKGEEGRFTFVSMDYFREITQENAKKNKQQSYIFYRRWMETRTGDINLAIDSILEKVSNGADGVYGLVNIESIAVMGHSLGGSAALAMPRQRDDIGAVIALESPFLYDIVGVENDEFVFTDAPYPVPVLNVYSDASWDHLSEWAQYARNYELLSDHRTTAVNVHLSGAGHFSLTDLSLASPLLVRLLDGGDSTRDAKEDLQSIHKVCLEFLDRHLKDQGELSRYGFFKDRRLGENPLASEQ